MAHHSVTSGVPAGLGVVVVGAGFIADCHLAALAASSRAHVAGVVDIDPARARASARAADSPLWTTDLDEALSWPEVDAAIVCTPNFTHEAIGLTVLGAGKHLLVEKPLATTVAAAGRLLAAAEAAGTTLMAAHTHRFYDYARAVKDTIDRGDIGRPVLTRLSLLGGWIWPDWRAWVIDPARSGGHTLHNGVHLLDLATWWMDDTPVSVYARGRKQTAAELDIDDYLEMTVGYAGGGTAVCEMSRGHRPSSLDRRDVLVLGTDGVLSLPAEQWGSALIREGGSGTLQPQATDGFGVQLEAFLDAIDGGQSLMPPAEAVRAVALAVAAQQSIESGQPVELASAEAGVE